MRLASPKKLIAFVAAAVLLLGAGCSADQKSQHQIAEQKWNDARASVLLGLAKDQYQTGNFDKAKITLTEALRLEPSSAKLHVLAGKLAIEQGQLEVADRELAAARQFDPKDAEADYLSGVVSQRWQKLDTAYAFYDAASQKAPAELPYVLAKAEMLVAMNRADEALAMLHDKVVYFEHSAVIRDATGELLVQQKRYPEAIEMLRQASVLDTDDIGVREHLAMALYLNNQFRDAGDLFARLLKEPANQTRADLYLALGECQLHERKPADARGSFESAARLNPNSVQAMTFLARAAMELNDLRRADLALRRATSLDPSNSEAQLLLGYLRLRENKMNDALSAFERASLDDRGDTVSLCMIGYVMQHAGHADRAKTFYAQALRLNPQDELATKLMASIE